MLLANELRVVGRDPLDPHLTQRRLDPLVDEDEPLGAVGIAEQVPIEALPVWGRQRRVRQRPERAEGRV